jgi:hypothetical protein
MGRHGRQTAAYPGGHFPTARRAGVAVLMAAGVLAGCGSWQSAVAATTCCDRGTPDQEEADPPAPSHGSNHGLLIIDNSNADSWLEVDRTLNTLVAGKGTAGSDHDGDGGDVDVTRQDPRGGSCAAPGRAGTASTPDTTGASCTSEGDD